ncbi:Uncharacterised protein [Neisseria meningitidis]|nr:Uncharacterised protein [Neisseria meningitidis]CWO17401.1 Uncharacterised protein [Neisseria meningitidis]CWO84660.1 Uncharacterised protein [Neisseria meningitidis]CWR56449.1 Uncharacterised protein [Neisseria meningitidis]CWR96364.1 Uncharacterised protein [Neisseria meningitidis]
MAGILRDSRIVGRHNRARAFLGQLAAVGGIDAQNGGFRAAAVVFIFADGYKGGTQYHGRFDGNALSVLQFHYPPFAARAVGSLVIGQE